MPAEGIEPLHPEATALVAQLRQSLGLLRVAFDATGEAMLIVDSGRHVRWVNQTAADLWGGGLALRVIGKPLDDLLRLRHLDQRVLPLSDPLHPLSQARLGEGQASLLVQALFAAAGDQPEVLQRMVTWRPISEMGGEFTLLIFRDLEPLEKSLQQQRAFINTLAHELRTPLAIVTGSLRRLDRRSQLVAPLDHALADAIEETKRVTALVDKLLLLSELDTDHFHWNLIRAPLQCFIDEWLHTLEPEMLSTISVQVDESLSSCRIELDQVAFSRIFDTLLENCLLFESEAMTLRVSECNASNAVDFTLYNNDVASTVNQPSTGLNDQSSLAGMEFVQGNGGQCDLGMSVVKNLVEGLGGAILTRSHCLGSLATGFIPVTIRFRTFN